MNQSSSLSTSAVNSLCIAPSLRISGGRSSRPLRRRNERLEKCGKLDSRLALDNQSVVACALDRKPTLSPRGLAQYESQFVPLIEMPGALGLGGTISRPDSVLDRFTSR